VTPATFVSALEDLLGRIERAAMYIEQRGTEVDLHELRLALIDVLSLVRRNPGIETATADLYEAALALVDGAAAGPPLARQRRLFGEARLRYRERLAEARPGELE
jgi:hypothetical protein